MRAFQRTAIETVTLRIAQEIINETDIISSSHITLNGIDALRIELIGTEYKLAIDNGILSFMAHVRAPISGYMSLASEWNILEPVGTAVCLDNGYAIKFGVVILGGAVRETLRDAATDFNRSLLRFIDKVAQNHQ